MRLRNLQHVLFIRGEKTPPREQSRCENMPYPPPRRRTAPSWIDSVFTYNMTLHNFTPTSVERRHIVAVRGFAFYGEGSRYRVYCA